MSTRYQDGVRPCSWIEGSVQRENAFDVDSFVPKRVGLMMTYRRAWPNQNLWKARQNFRQKNWETNRKFGIPEIAWKIQASTPMGVLESR
jgi:hypothetical protein